MVERPLGVTVLGVIQILFSIILLALVLVIGLGSFKIYPDFSIVVIAVGVLSLIFAVSFLTGHNWARILMMIGAVLDIISIIGIIWGIILLVYLTRPNVRKYFESKKK